MQKTLTVIAAMLLMLVVSSIIYDQTGKSDVTITVDLTDSSDPFESIPNLAPGESITSVTEIDRDTNTYEIVYSTRKRNLLQWLTDHQDVESAELAQ